jgi:hypothetical protein
MVVIPNGTVTEIDLCPKQRLTREAAIEKFGLDYQIVRYSAGDCLDEGGTIQMYENPEGDVEQIEYRQRGLALNVHLESLGDTFAPPSSSSQSWTHFLLKRKML